MIWLIILIPIGLLLLYALWYDRKHAGKFNEEPHNLNAEYAKSQSYKQHFTNHFHGGGGDTGY